MKKLINLILVIILVGATMTFTMSIFIEGVSRQVSTNLIQNELRRQLNIVVKEIQTVIPFDDQGAVDKLVLVLTEDEKVSEAIDRYTKRFIHNLAKNDSNAGIDINDEVQTLIMNHSEEFGGLLGDIINPVYKEVIVRLIVTRIDFNSYYLQGIQRVRTNLSPMQLRIVDGVDVMMANNDAFRQGSVILAISSAITLVLINKFKLRLVGVGLFVSGLLHLIMKWLIPIVLMRKVPQLSGLLSFELFIKSTYILIPIGILIMIVGQIQERRETL